MVVCVLQLVDRAEGAPDEIASPWGTSPGDPLADIQALTDLLAADTRGAYRWQSMPDPRIRPGHYLETGTTGQATPRPVSRFNPKLGFRSW